MVLSEIASMNEGSGKVRGSASRNAVDRIKAKSPPQTDFMMKDLTGYGVLSGASVTLIW